MENSYKVPIIMAMCLLLFVGAFLIVLAITDEGVSAPSAPGTSGNPTVSNPSSGAAEHKHEYGKTEIIATCTHQGYILFECSCGDSYKENFKEQLPHKFTSEIIPPTTQDRGYTLHICSVCGSQHKDNFTDPLPEGSEEETPKDPAGSGNNNTGETPGPGPGVGTPDTEDYDFCPKCGIRLWTTWYPTGCFTFLEDTVCDCGVLVHAMECHHH